MNKFLSSCVILASITLFSPHLLAQDVEATSTPSPAAPQVHVDVQAPAAPDVQVNLPAPAPAAAPDINIQVPGAPAERTNTVTKESTSVTNVVTPPSNNGVFFVVGGILALGSIAAFFALSRNR